MVEPCWAHSGEPHCLHDYRHVVARNADGMPIASVIRSYCCWCGVDRAGLHGWAVPMYPPSEIIPL